MATDVTKVKREEVWKIPKPLIPAIKGVMHALTRAHVWIFMKSQGRIGSTFAGADCCMVGMTGRKTGKKRHIPLMYLPHNDELLLVASQGGMDKNPTWYYNIAANPEIEIIAKGRTRKMVARQANDQEKAERWPSAVACYPDFDNYQARTDRDIPLFICTDV